MAMVREDVITRELEQHANARSARPRQRVQ